MAREWTSDQQEVIQSRKQNLLVSAAAGSGKTAVLVERIANLVKDGMDVDRILVVTFTKAAASEMKDRIAAAITKMSLEHPEDKKLKQQAALIHNAMFCTIDSFCAYVVRNYYHCLDLEPDFRNAQESETKMLRAQVLTEVFEKKYEEGSDRFFQLIRNYGSRTSDEAVKNMVLELFDASQAAPWPKEFLNEKLLPYTISEMEEYKQQSFWKRNQKEFTENIDSILALMNEAMELCKIEGGPAHFTDNITADLEFMNQVKEKSQESFEDAIHMMEDFKFKNMARTREIEKPELQDEVKSLRDGYKAVFKETVAIGLFFSDDSLRQIRNLSPYVQELVELTLLFTDAFAAAKKKKNILDFADIEHAALNILVDPETKQPTEIAKDFRRQFETVMIDEYQDSNQLQETILRTVSREEDGEFNRFMVGDVKQSIYGFRQADPTIFSEKKRDYHSEKEASQRLINLGKNFRSRNEILDVVNDTFTKLMKTDMGDIDYDEQNRLYLGNMEFPACPDHPEMFRPEFLFVRMDKDTREELEAESGVELEAKVVASKIQQLMKTQLVTDAATKQLRPIAYRDIVILIRNAGSKGDVFERELRKLEIPVHVVSSKGYFASPEVDTMLNMLRVLDNPKQDIPLVAVLHNLFHLDNDTISMPRTEYPREPYHEAFVCYCEKHPEYAGNAAWDFIGSMREISADLPIHELIRRILSETEYDLEMAAKRDGDVRKANLDRLVDVAVEYESTSYRGLFNFVAYINKMKDYDLDMGVAELVGEEDDAVRIMTMHKSKGLQFPVVFCSGLGIKFNMNDINGDFSFHTRYGIGLTTIDRTLNIKHKGIYKDFIESEKVRDLLGEELRILYVAMTRAEEKLILTGCNAMSLENYNKIISGKNPCALALHNRIGAKRFTDWLVPALYKSDFCNYSTDGADLVRMTNLENQLEESEHLLKLEELPQYADAQACQEMEHRQGFEYPFAEDNAFKSKYSVSDIKHVYMEKAKEAAGEETNGEDAEELFAENLEAQLMKAVASENKYIRTRQEVLTKEENQGAERGTATHRVMECFDFGQPHFADTLKAQVDRMVESGKLPPSQEKLLVYPKLQAFLDSDLAKRMAEADARGDLYREQPFVMGDMPEKFFETDQRSSREVLVQGIIDAFFLEEDGIVLLDYKTDAVKTPEKLRDLYAKQLDLYADLLTRIFKLPVKEELLYSFALNQVVSVH